MIYEKDLVTKNYKYKTLVINDFSKGIDTEANPELSGYKNAITLFNFIVRNGKLEDGYGAGLFKLPTSVNAESCTLMPNYNFAGDYEGIWLYKYYSKSAGKDSYDLILYGSNGYLYWLGLFDNNPNIFRLYEIELTSKPTIINYRMYDRDYLLICNETEGMIAWDGDTLPETIASAPSIRSACLHGTRLFALTDDRYYIRYSKELDPTNWLMTSTQESSGFIRVSDQMGGMNKIVSFMGNLYVFRDNGITKIKFYEDDNTYDISQVFFAGSKIYKDSIAVCEDKIYFVTRDNMYYFDGVSVNSVDLRLKKFMVDRTFESSVGAFHKGKYYLACYLDYNDNNVVADDGRLPSANKLVNNVLICLGTKSQSYDIMRGIDIVDMLPLDTMKLSKLLLLSRKSHSNAILELTTNGQNFDGDTFKQWSSDYYTLGDLRHKKIIKSVTILANCYLELIVKTEDKEKSVSTYGSPKPQTFRLDLIGQGFSMLIRSSDHNCDIRSISFEVAYEDD